MRYFFLHFFLPYVYNRIVNISVIFVNTLGMLIVLLIYNIGLGVGVMDNMVNSIEKQLKELSLSFIDFFDKLKEVGVISQEEYDKHTAVKRKFLDTINDHKNQ
jgi:hypothetical protein